jgi:hypothetical protein
LHALLKNFDRPDYLIEIFVVPLYTIFESVELLTNEKLYADFSNTKLLQVVAPFAYDAEFPASSQICKLLCTMDVGVGCPNPKIPGILAKNGILVKKL